VPLTLLPTFSPFVVRDVALSHSERFSCSPFFEAFVTASHKVVLCDHRCQSPPGRSAVPPSFLPVKTRPWFLHILGGILFQTTGKPGPPPHLIRSFSDEYTSRFYGQALFHVATESPPFAELACWGGPRGSRFLGRRLLTKAPRPFVALNNDFSVCAPRHSLTPADVG